MPTSEALSVAEMLTLHHLIHQHSPLNNCTST